MPPRPRRRFRPRARIGRLLLPCLAWTLPGCFMGAPRGPGRGAGPDRPEGMESDLSFDRPWSGWDDLREPVLHFRFARDWSAADGAGGPLDWKPVRDPNPKDEWAAAFELPETTAGWDALFRPPAPVPVPVPFDSADLWLLWEPAGPPAGDAGRGIRVTAWLELRTGEALRIPFERPDAPGWQLAHQALDRDFAGPDRFPARLLGFVIEAGPGPPGRLLFSGWTPYLRCRAPLHRPAPPFRGEEEDPEAPLPAVEVEPARLFLPGPPAGPVRMEPGRITAWLGEGRARAEATLDPARPLDGLRVRFPDGESVAWSGPRLAGPERGYPGPLVFRTRAGGGVRLGYAEGLRLTVEPEGHGLALTYEDHGGSVSAVSWPWLPAAVPARGPANPFLSVRRVESRTGRARHLALAWDPFASNASAGPESDPDRGAHASRVPYRAADDGRRPPLRERFVLSAAERPGDLAPRIPGPAGPFPAPGQVLLVVPDGAPAGAPLSRFGLDALVVIRDPGKPEEASGGHPLRAGWSREDVAREPDGSWSPGTEPGTARRKPTALFRDGREAAEEAAGRLLRLPLRPPGDWTDYDSRLPGAGSFQGAVRGAVAAWRGPAPGPAPPLIVEDDAGWLFAPWAAARLRSDPQGLAVGEAAGFPPGFPPPSPPLGAGRFVAWREAHPGLAPGPLLDRFLAAQIAAGGGGRLPEPEAVETAELVLAARVLQTLHARTRGGAPEWKGVERAGRITDPGAEDPVEADRERVYRRYAGGLEVWVNLSTEREWSVRVGPDLWTMPPGGWVAAAPGYRNLSILSGGARVHWIEDGDTVFFRGGEGVPFQGFEAGGGVLVRRGNAALFGSDVEVYDYGRSGRVLIAGDEWTGWLARAWECLSEEGAILGPARAAAEGGSIRLQGPPGTLLYRLPRDPGRSRAAAP